MKPMSRTMKRWLGAMMILALVTVSLRVFAAPLAPLPSTARAFARVSIPKHELYVGESVPITVQAYYAANTGVTITGMPAASTPDFTMSVGDAAQGRATIGDATYLVVTWKGRISPAKAGHYALRTTVPSTLEWRAAVRAAPRSFGDEDPFGDLFGSIDHDDDQGGDPFAAMQQRMQSMMNQAMHDFDVGPVQKREVVLESQTADLTVRPLPAAGRPPSFSGAVGHFELDATVNDAHVRVGEPIELRLAVRGDGNFDRVSTPGLPDSKELKTYAPTVTRKDDVKTFVQAVVPQQPGVAEIPSVELSYFDPDAARYVTKRSAPIAIDVKPGQALAARADGRVPDAANGPTLAPNADHDGKTVASLRPLYTRSNFWLAQLAPLGMLAAAASFVVRRRRVLADPHHALRKGAWSLLRRERARMNRALAAGDAPTYFAAARGALQQRLGALWGIVPEAITLAEIETRMTGSRLDTLRAVFEEADAARFGVGASGRDLARHDDAVRRILANPEAS
jgi:hypothetical protein